jgi:hypothetical protein
MEPSAVVEAEASPPVASVMPSAVVEAEASPPMVGGTPAATRRDLTLPLSKVECPVTRLEEFQACDGAFCIRAASMVTGVNERHKILWLPQNGFKGKLRVQAERYGGGTTLRQVLEDTQSPPEPDYPSVWQFPTTGCWRLTAAAGEATGSVFVWVE